MDFYFGRRQYAGQSTDFAGIKKHGSKGAMLFLIVSVAFIVFAVTGLFGFHHLLATLFLAARTQDEKGKIHEEQQNDDI